MTATKETIVTRDCLPHTFKFLTHAQHKMSSRLAESTFRSQSNLLPDLLLDRCKAIWNLFVLYNKDWGEFRGGEAAAAPPFSSSEIFFLSKYTIILSFCKQAVGTFDFFS